MGHGGWVRNAAPSERRVRTPAPTSHATKARSPVQDNGRDLLLEAIERHVMLHQSKHVDLICDVERSFDGTAQSDGQPM